MRIVLCFPVDSSHVDQISQMVPDAEVVDAGQQRIADEIFAADIFCGHAKVPVDWPEVVKQGRLQWIQSSAAGLDHCLVPAVIDSDVMVTSASGLFANQVAEQTMALLYGLVRRLPVFFRAAQKREFVRQPTADLHGKTIGIVGLGGNGRRIAQLLAPLQTRLIATDWFPTNCPAEIDQMWPAEGLGELAEQADVMILCVPLTDQTDGMIDASILQRMKPGSLLINVARGRVVVESALIEALKCGQLGGAGLDVTQVEPLPTSSPLWDMPQVIITPHVGAQSDRRVSDTTDFFCQNLQRFLNGQTLLNTVDKRLGFPPPQHRVTG